MDKVLSLTYHLPNLHDIIFRNGADNPRLVWIPCEVRDLGSMTTMHEEKLGWTVFGIFCTLLIANFTVN